MSIKVEHFLDKRSTLINLPWDDFVTKITPEVLADTVALKIKEAIRDNPEVQEKVRLAIAEAINKLDKELVFAGIKETLKQELKK